MAKKGEKGECMAKKGESRRKIIMANRFSYFSHFSILPQRYLRTLTSKWTCQGALWKAGRVQDEPKTPESYPFKERNGKNKTRSIEDQTHARVPWALLFKQNIEMWCLVCLVCLVPIDHCQSVTGPRAERKMIKNMNTKCE